MPNQFIPKLATVVGCHSQLVLWRKALLFVVCCLLRAIDLVWLRKAFHELLTKLARRETVQYLKFQADGLLIQPQYRPCAQLVAQCQPRMPPQHLAPRLVWLRKAFPALSTIFDLQDELYRRLTQQSYLGPVGAREVLLATIRLWGAAQLLARSLNESAAPTTKDHCFRLQGCSHHETGGSRRAIRARSLSIVALNCCGLKQFICRSC